jgi:hypothetical protein
VNPACTLLRDEKLVVEPPKESQCLMNAGNIEVVESQQLPDSLRSLGIEKVRRRKPRRKLFEEARGAIVALKVGEQTRRTVL